MGYGKINYRGRGLRSSAEGRAQRVAVFTVSSALSVVFQNLISEDNKKSLPVHHNIDNHLLPIPAVPRDRADRSGVDCFLGMEEASGSTPDRSIHTFTPAGVAQPGQRRQVQGLISQEFVGSNPTPRISD